MTAQEAKQLNIKLQFTTDTRQTDRALKDMETQAKRTTEALRGTGGAASGAGGAPGPGGAGKAGTAANPQQSFLDSLAKIAVKTSLATAALQGLTKTIDIFQDDTKQFADQVFKSALAIGKSIPLIGGLVSAAE